MVNNSASTQDADEIDLFELLGVLWKQKLLIVSVAVLVTAIAAAYALLTKPIYEARIFLQPPTSNEIADFNYGRTTAAELVPFSIRDIYDVFIRNLQSEDLRRAFFVEVYLPSLPEARRVGSQDGLYSEYLNDLAIGLPTKEQPDRYSVSVQSQNPAQATEWTKAFVARAGVAAKNEVIKNVAREAEVRARNLGQQIITLQETEDKIRADSITQLHEALKIAQAIHLTDPPIISGNVAAEVSAAMNGELTYMRGTKALEAEIRNLDERKSNDPFIVSLRSLQIKQSFYKNMQVNPNAVSVYRVDGSVEQPDRPIKPKKLLIVAVGMILGGGLGLLIALFRHLILVRKGRSR
ncbi:MAG: hypothetical protein JWR17_4 [Pseudomonas sp.]|jgi:chain length determinant protein (polysaccharide antigen chain regulator)|uniref:LPS O-antigen chain length determinant protein WzzB n=1 Tax=Pseudomonas sp. TaxID=306 RepID=UPI00262FA622|nr:Wzz/FepE/Etk N-terminal domain-containing protein [Pseudomonas sp.]MDB6047258.1 hypothetical protein [Pseudomonas sp.]